MTILVTGVTGKTGRRVVESLVTRGVGVRGLVRDLERGKMATLGMAVELALGDFDDPETIAEAARGCDGMYLVVADGKNQVRQEVDAARVAVEAGVDHIVKLSSSDADQRSSYWAVAHSDIEQALAKMEVGYSAVRPNYFMDGFLDLFKADSSGNITMEAPIGDGKIGAIDTYDIGETSAVLLAGGKPLNGHALLTGPENISMVRVADAFASVAGRKITYVSPDPITYGAELEIEDSASTGDIVDIYEEIRSGTAEMVSNEVKWITGTPARSVEQFARANVEAINAAISAALSRW